MSGVSKYLWITYTSARSNLAYLSELIMRTAFIAVILYIFGRLWTAVYTETGVQTLAGLTLVQIIWYLVISEAIMVSTPRIALDVDEDVRSGRLASDLIRPVSYVLHRFAHTMGERCVRFGVNCTAGAVVALLIVGPIPLSASGVAMFLAVLPLAFVLEFLGHFAIGLCAFWLENTRGLMLIYSRATMILGGMLLPLEMFPTAFQPIVRALPFASMVYAPARMFAAPDWNLFVDMVRRQGLAAMAFAIFVTLLQRLALRRLQTNGG